MTISSQITSIVYPANGVQTAWNYNFLIPADSAGNALVQVLVEGSDGSTTILTPGSFSISGVGNPSGGTVVYPLVGTPLQSGQTLVIMRNVPYTQLTAISDQAFFPHTVEDIADWLTMQTQQLAEVDGRALQFRPGDTGLGFLPPANLRKGLVLGFDATTGAPVAVAGGGGGGGSSAWSALTGVPQIIQNIDVLGPTASGQIIEFTGPTGAHLIPTPTFSQNFNYSALTGVPTNLTVIAALTPAAGQIIEWLGPSSAHMIPTPSGGGGGGNVSGPGSAVVGNLVSWNSAAGTLIADAGFVPSANGKSLVSAANYAAMRGLLGIGSIGLLSDLSTVLVAGAGIGLLTSSGQTTIINTGGGGGGGSATFLSYNDTGAFSGSDTVNINLPTGASVGDLVFIVLANTSPGPSSRPVGPTGASTLFTQSYNTTVNMSFWVGYKVITSADAIAGYFVCTVWGGSYQAHAYLAAYRGPQSASLVAAATETLTIAGFNKVATNVGTIAMLFQNSSASANTSPGSPFTTRRNTTGVFSVFGNIFQIDALIGSPYVDGTNIVFGGATNHPLSFAVELRSDGGGGGGGSGVTTVNGRNGNVVLTGADVSTNLGAQIAAKTTAGTGVTLSYNSGTDILTISAPGGGSGVSSFNGRSGAVSFGSGDLAPVLSAGTGITLNNTGSAIQISATGGGGGGVPTNYNGAAENSITPAQSATTNTTNLNNLISTLNAAGGGTIWINGSGAYNVNGTINLKSNVNIIMDGGAYLTWTGAAGGTIVSSASTDVLIQCVLRLNINEGSSFSGVVFNLHSAQFNDIYVIAIGNNSGSIFAQINADSTAGEFSGGGRNVVFNRFTFQHRGTCQYGLILGGITTGFGGQAQVVTDSVFHNCQFNNAVFRGFKFNNWCDTVTFSGNSYVGLSGSNGIGVVVNEGRINNYSVYNVKFQHLAVDTFGGPLNRAGVYLYESKQIYIDGYYNDPQAELGAIVNIACASYLINISDPGTNNLKTHYLGWSSVTP